MSQTTYDFQSKENNGHAPLNNIINAKLIAYVIGILLWVEGGMLLVCMGVSCTAKTATNIFCTLRVST